MRILMVMYGWSDPGGGTLLPRAIAKELARRGHDVQVFHAGVGPADGSAEAYRCIRRVEDGVALAGVYHRAAPFHATHQPLLDLEDPRIEELFEEVVDSFRPEVAHVHNLHGLGVSLLQLLADRDVPTFFTPHNYWLVCPSLYLLTDAQKRCDGPGDGIACASCNSRPALARDFARRRTDVRDRVVQARPTILAPSCAVRDILIQNGYPAGMLRLLLQGHAPFDRLWDEVGRHRLPARPSGPVRFGSIGSAMGLKGTHLLVEAAQRVEGNFTVDIHGDVAPDYRRLLERLDARGRMRLHGTYSYEQLPDILSHLDVVVLASIWDDCAPLSVAECHAAGLPVLGARVGGIPDFIQEDVDGATFLPGDPEDLAKWLQALVDDPSYIERWQAGVRPPRTFGDYVDRLLALYQGQEIVEESLSRRPAVRVRWPGETGVPEWAHALSLEPGDAEVEVLDERGRRIAGHVLSKPPDISIQDAPPRQGIWLAWRESAVDQADGVVPRPPEFLISGVAMRWKGRTPRLWHPRLLESLSGPVMPLDGDSGRRLLLMPEWAGEPWAEAVARFLEQVRWDSDLSLVLAVHENRPELFRQAVETIESLVAGREQTPEVILVPIASGGAPWVSLIRACDALLSLDQPHLAHAARELGLEVIHALECAEFDRIRRRRDVRS